MSNMSKYVKYQLRLTYFCEINNKPGSRQYKNSEGNFLLFSSGKIWAFFHPAVIPKIPAGIFSTEKSCVSTSMKWAGNGENRAGNRKLTSGEENSGIQEILLSVVR